VYYDTLLDLCMRHVARYQRNPM